MSRTRIEGWIPAINAAKSKLAAIDSDVNKISNSLICAFLEHESGGNTNAYIPSESQLAGGGSFTVSVGDRKKTFSKRWLQNENPKTGGVRLIMGGFQGSANWWNFRPRAFYKAKKLSGLEYVRRVRDNKQVQVEDFIASLMYRKDSHKFRPDLMAINHSRDSSGKASRDLVATLTLEQQQQVASGQKVTGDIANAVVFAQNWVQKSRANESGLLFRYARAIMKNHIKWAEYLGEEDPTDQYILQWITAEFQRDGSRSIYAKLLGQIQQRPESLSRSGPENMPFHSGNFITPEELRKGIIPQFMSINEWYLTQISESETKRVGNAKDEDRVSLEDLLNFQVNEDEKSYQTIKSVRADEDITERRRYIQSIVEAEFYRRRFASRSTTPVSGPFNPYPVSGMPGLILAPDRPILGMVASVNHTISVQSGSGTTTVAMSSPRYWDEGEVFYYLGGQNNGTLSRQFPQWHNSLVVPTNNIDQPSSLDVFYDFMVGTTSIPYESNHSNKTVNDQIVTSLFKDRNTQGFDISAETLEVKEYNVKIAETDSEGFFAVDTLARRFYGKVKPNSNNRPKASVQEQLEFTERYGVRERELLENFLGNRITQIEGGYTVVYGPTFNNVETADGNRHLNQIQQGVIEYMKELEGRMLDGGV